MEVEAEDRRRTKAKLAEEAERNLLEEREAFRRNLIVFNGQRISSRSQAPMIDLQIRGEDNAIIIDEPTGPGVLHVILDSKSRGCKFEFGSSNRIVANVFVSFSETGAQAPTESSVKIGSGNLFNGNAHIVAGTRPSTLVEIGNENLFANNIHILGAVDHLIYDINTKEKVSAEAGISIESRIWICQDVIILNKSRIASDNIVAARSVVNRAFEEPNTIVAGTPGKVTKRGMMWHLNTNDDYLTAMSPLSGARSATAKSA